MKEVKAEVDEFQKEIQRHLNANTELGRELEEIKTKTPQMSIDIKNSKTVESVKQSLESMKVLDDKLKTSNLRMNAIKDILEMSCLQVENVEEQKLAPKVQVQEVEEVKGAEP